MLTLIENGHIYAPEPLGRRSVLLVGSRVARLGPVDHQACEALDIGFETSWTTPSGRFTSRAARARAAEAAQSCGP